MKSSAEDVLKAIKEDESLRKEVIVMISKEYPREYLSRVKLDPGRINAALGDVVVSCKEWQE
ncbi:MAG: hypothetical protein ACN4GR_06035 [Arenicellales bacterium]